MRLWVKYLAFVLHPLREANNPALYCAQVHTRRRKHLTTCITRYSSANLSVSSSDYTRIASTMPDMEAEPNQTTNPPPSCNQALQSLIPSRVSLYQ